MKTLIFNYHYKGSPNDNSKSSSRFLQSVNVIFDDSGNISIIEFTGKGCHGYRESDIDDEFIRSIYEIHGQNYTANDYQAPNYSGTSYSEEVDQTGMISQIPIDRLTIMTTGRSGEIKTAAGY